MPSGNGSSPARGMWIEMYRDVEMIPFWQVVPRKGDVDRNNVNARGKIAFDVVPRKGDVDRNIA